MAFRFFTVWMKEISKTIKSMIYQMLKFFKKNSFIFHAEMILTPLFCFEDTKNTGLLIFNSLKQEKLIFNFLLTVTEKN